MNNPYLNKSISHATLKTSHLLSNFLPVLKELININLNFLGADTHLVMIKGLVKGEGYLESLEYLERNNLDSTTLEEDASEFLNEFLFDTLEYFAPKGFYFGNTEGDGSDFGFWETYEDELDWNHIAGDR